MSWITSTWPSQAGPAPMPMVGIGQLGRDFGGQLGRNPLQHHGKGPGVLARHRHPPGCVGLLLAPLHLVAAHAVDRLGRQPDVAHDRDVDRR